MICISYIINVCNLEVFRLNYEAAVLTTQPPRLDTLFCSLSIASLPVVYFDQRLGAGRNMPKNVFHKKS